MSGPGDENPPARHLSHFFVLSDGSSYEISVRGGFIHIRGTSFENYEEEGVGKIENLQSTEITVSYTSVLDAKLFKDTKERKMILQKAELEMHAVDDEGEKYTWSCEIPATWPASMRPPMLPRGASERQDTQPSTQPAHNQPPALEAFFQNTVASGILHETAGWRTRNTLASDQIHTYTYSVFPPEPPLTASGNSGTLTRGSSMPNLYLTTHIPVLQSGVACVASEPRPQRPALRVKKTLAPKRQPPRPPRPPSDSSADDQQWEYSWRLVVPVGSAPGQWPRDSALALAEESFSETVENEAGHHEWVLEQVMQQLESLLEPCSAQDAGWWARVRNSYQFEGGDGALLGDREFNKQHLLFLYFRDDGRRITLDDWLAGRRSVTSVSILYRGPARFRPRHPSAQQNRQQLTEYRSRPNEVSPVFGF
jgi:hypothetical protein